MRFDGTSDGINAPAIDRLILNSQGYNAESTDTASAKIN